MSSDPIRTHFVVLCNSLNVGEILPYLRAERMVTPDEYETLSNTNGSTTIKQKRERLLLMMPKKGSDYFKNFGNCLVWSGQRDLAKHIGVDVGAVPPCPHQKTLRGKDVTPQDSFQVMASLMTPGGTLPPGMSTPHHPSSTHPEQFSSFLSRERHSGEGQWTPRPLLPGTQHHPTTLPPYSTPATTHPHQPYQQPQQPSQPHGGYPQHYPSYFDQQAAPPPPISGDASGGPPLPSEPPKVFVLYHKDPSLEATHNISTVDLIDKIKDMADILSSIGGFELSIDLYHKGDVGNWGTWTDEKIKESRYVVLLCSPRLAAGLRNLSGEFAQLDTERGSFFTSSVVNLINSCPQKFVPTFLFNYANEVWIPTALATAPRYSLDIDNFVDHVRSEPGTDNFYREVSDAFGMIRFLSWERLVRHLRGSSHDVPPPPPSHPLGQPGGFYYNPPQPPLPPTSQFTESELVRVSEAVTSDWQALGIRLGVSSAQVDAIDDQNADPTRGARVMLDAWIRRRGPYATRSALKGALLGLSFGAIAARLFEHD